MVQKSTQIVDEDMLHIWEILDVQEDQNGFGIFLLHIRQQGAWNFEWYIIGARPFLQRTPQTGIDCIRHDASGLAAVLEHETVLLPPAITASSDTTSPFELQNQSGSGHKPPY